MRSFRIVIAVAAIIVLIGFAASVGFRNELVIVNRSGRPLVDVTIRVGGGGSAHRFDSIPPDGERREPFQVASDGGFQFSATFPDGTRISASGGYVSGSSRGEHVTITVNPDGGIQIDQS